MPVGVFGLMTTVEWYPSIVHVLGSPDGLKNEVKNPGIHIEIFCVEDFVYYDIFLPLCTIQTKRNENDYINSKSDCNSSLYQDILPKYFTLETPVKFESRKEFELER